jgi:hypothetical protein
MVDAYQDITIPFQMSSVEFFSLVKEHLTEDGVMVVNMNMRSDSEDGINDYLSDTIASVFDTVYTVDVENNTNRELFASDNPDIADRFFFNASLSSDGDIAKMMTMVSDGLVKYEAGNRILTDDKAPVELLSMKAIDEIIEEEVSHYKEIYKEKGWKGVLESF